VVTKRALDVPMVRATRSEEFDVYRVSDGTVEEFWSFSSDQRATDAFWS